MKIFQNENIPKIPDFCLGFFNFQKNSRFSNLIENNPRTGISGMKKSQMATLVAKGMEYDTKLHKINKTNYLQFGKFS